MTKLELQKYTNDEVRKLLNDFIKEDNGFHLKSISNHIGMKFSNLIHFKLGENDIGLTGLNKIADFLKNPNDLKYAEKRANIMNKEIIKETGYQPLDSKNLAYIVNKYLETYGDDVKSAMQEGESLEDYMTNQLEDMGSDLAHTVMSQINKVKLIEITQENMWS